MSFWSAFRYFSVFWPTVGTSNPYSQDHHILLSTLLKRFQNANLASQHRSPLVHSSLRINCEANFLSAQFLLHLISSSVRVSRLQKRRSESPCNLQRTHTDVPPKSPPTPLRRKDGQTREAHNCNAAGNSTAVGGENWSQLEDFYRANGC